MQLKKFCIGRRAARVRPGKRYAILPLSRSLSSCERGGARRRMRGDPRNAAVSRFTFLINQVTIRFHRDTAGTRTNFKFAAKEHKDHKENFSFLVFVFLWSEFV
jgi:hypothetical protein